MNRASFFACALLVACGGAAPAESTTPANPSTAAPDAQETKGATQPEVSGARSELDRAEEKLSAAQSDCAAACRALASMERAADHLCSLDSGAECRRAHDRVDAARERIRATCGGCGS